MWRTPRAVNSVVIYQLWRLGSDFSIIAIKDSHNHEKLYKLVTESKAVPQGRHQREALTDEEGVMATVVTVDCSKYVYKPGYISIDQRH